MAALPSAKTFHVSVPVSVSEYLYVSLPVFPMFSSHFLAMCLLYVDVYTQAVRS